MKSRANLKRALAAVVAGVLIGGGVTAVSPAGAEVSQFAATNWKKIWKKKLQPHADKRYYTKAASNAKYTAAGAAYSKAEADAKYQAKGSYAAAGSSYTKAESDAKYAPTSALIRGTTMQTTTAAAAGAKSGASISFGVTLSAPPTAHYIKLGDPIPLGCSGTPAAPVAEAGNLCVFENFASNNASNIIVTPTGAALGATTVGAVLFANAAAAGDTVVTTVWALRPAGIATGLGGGKSPASGGADVFGK